MEAEEGIKGGASGFNERTGALGKEISISLGRELMYDLVIK